MTGFIWLKKGVSDHQEIRTDILCSLRYNKFLSQSTDKDEVVCEGPLHQTLPPESG
jgi:hypothetical protein